MEPLRYMCPNTPEGLALLDNKRKSAEAFGDTVVAGTVRIGVFTVAFIDVYRKKEGK